MVQPHLDISPRRSFAQIGASLIEYSILLAFIVVVAILGVTFVGERLSSSFSNSASQF